MPLYSYFYHVHCSHDLIPLSFHAYFFKLGLTIYLRYRNEGTKIHTLHVISLLVIDLSVIIFYHE